MIGAFEGIDGAHSQLALEAYFRARSGAEDATTLGTPSFRAAAVAVSAGRADVGIVPIDNAIAGTVRDGYDLLLEFDLVPVAEIVWRMDHRLLGTPGTTIEDVREILAHPLVIAECGKFLASLPHARTVPCEDTGIAAREVARAGNTGIAAIAPPSAAVRYGLVELAPRVADHPENFTRFIVFRGHDCNHPALAVDESDGPRKTSLILVTSNAAGSLSRCLGVIASAGISVGKLESKPTLGRPQEAEFYLDIDGDLLDPQHANALAALRRLRSICASSAATAQTHTSPQSQPESLRHRSRRCATCCRRQPSFRRSRRKAPLPRARPVLRAIRDRPVRACASATLTSATACSRSSQVRVRLNPAGKCWKPRMPSTTLGAVMLRGGAFKPRTNPYAFQGLGWEGVTHLCEAGRATGMPTVSEVMSIDQVERMAAQVDVLQIGARNMQNFDLLKAIGRTGKPVLLKRGLSATIEELIAAAEYILAEGNPERNAVRARNPHVRNGDAQHARSLGDTRAARENASSGLRRSVTRRRRAPLDRADVPRRESRRRARI